MLLGGIAALVLSGCAVSAFATPPIQKPQLAAHFQQALAEGGIQVRLIDCGQGTVDPMPGNQVRCMVTAGDGSTIGATVTVTDVHGDVTYKFDHQPTQP